MVWVPVGRIVDLHCIRVTGKGRSERDVDVNGQGMPVIDRVGTRIVLNA